MLSALLLEAVCRVLRANSLCAMYGVPIPLAIGVPIDGRSGPNDIGATPLMRCCCHDHEQTLSALMTKGAHARCAKKETV